MLWCKEEGGTCRPAAAQRVRGTCPLPTSRTGSWCCSRRTGCTRTGRPAWRAPPCSAGAPAPPCTRTNTGRNFCLSDILPGALATRRDRSKLNRAFSGHCSAAGCRDCCCCCCCLKHRLPSGRCRGRVPAGRNRAHSGAPGGGVAADEVGLDGLVLGVEVGHVHHQVPDHEHVRQRRDLRHRLGVPIHLRRPPHTSSRANSRRQTVLRSIQDKGRLTTCRRPRASGKAGLLLSAPTS